MDAALTGILAGAAVSAIFKLIDWWLARTGRQIAGRADIRADLDIAIKQIKELREELANEVEARRKLQTDYDALWRKFGLVVVERDEAQRQRDEALRRLAQSKE